MRHLTLAAGFLLCTSVQATAFSLDGTYSVEGVTLDGQRYDGQAIIKMGKGGECSIRWNTGGQVSEGFCMAHNKTFSAAYKLGDAIGLVVYDINSNGSLSGTWTITGNPMTGSETLTPQDQL